ncbi:xanthine dehydrogenase family protein molybdopterin-binding subunit [Sphingobium subterraneum]|uniref:Isoquinoline 1-oxidoreductase beta subunit n=1 Tax=Sphingobium subterraneum TaxID=627688 RepID=A0A841J1V7_9SPHN|nr:molybdopterin cofactor-binding domain-containing protein [Sphingobium subterraneum]MBB6124640.1 isoquinoline 1-oxidoreductase beta subunit [Sphingobium subterraneum]
MRRIVDRVRDTGGAGVDRRSLLIGGGAVAGLLIAWGVWPRSYRPNLAVASDETLFNAFLKIDTAGQIIVVVPQAEMGQGVSTVLPQILADELGADWRTVAVQSAPISPLYANSLLAGEALASDWSALAGGAGRWAIAEFATRNAIMLTGGSTSVRMFTQAYREAGRAGRVLLCKAAAARWDVPWETCDIVDGLVTDGQRKLRIGELAAEAAAFTLPDILPERQGEENRLWGEDVARIDLPSKVDGSHNYAADIRLPDMLFASIRQGPVGAVALGAINEAAARKVTGFVQLVKRERWVAALGTDWWAANKALDALDPQFMVADTPLSSARIDAALDDAFESEQGRRLYEQGDLAAMFEGAQAVKREYSVAPALHLAIEPPCATARVEDGKAEVWTATQAPMFCRRAVAKALGFPESAVVLYPLSAGGSFGRRMEHDTAVQAALLAQEVNRPVQLLWSRLEETIQDRPRAPAKARMAARLGRGGRIEAWSAKVASPTALAETWARISDGADPMEAARTSAGSANRLAVSGMPGPYALSSFAVDHYPAAIALPTGRWRANADGASAFFTESFIDELAHQAGIEPMSFRIQMLGGQARLAHCLTTAAAMGGWQGGIAGSGQGIACHVMDGSFIAILVECSMDNGRPRVDSIVAVVDCGDQPHPDIARQQIEGGLMFGLASALGGAAEYRGGLPRRAIMGRLGLPRLSDIGEISVELIQSSAEPGGVGQIGVPPVAPALANALFTVTGRRHRNLPLVPVA